MAEERKGSYRDKYNDWLCENQYEESVDGEDGAEVVPVDCLWGLEKIARQDERMKMLSLMEDVYNASNVLQQDRFNVIYNKIRGGL